LVEYWTRRTGHKVISPTVQRDYEKMLMARLGPDKIPPNALKAAVEGALVEPFYVERKYDMPENIWCNGKRVAKLVRAFREWKGKVAPSEAAAAKAAQTESALAAARERFAQVAAEMAPPEPDEWAAILAALQEPRPQPGWGKEPTPAINSHSFGTWFRPTRAIGLTADAIIVEVPNDAFRDWISKNYGKAIKESMAHSGVARDPVYFTSAETRPEEPG
jgi:hypothetical protein